MFVIVVVIIATIQYTMYDYVRVECIRTLKIGGVYYLNTIYTCVFDMTSWT